MALTIDHILLLETSLFHYEYILSHCQPAYLSHLNVGFSFVRGKRDRAILALSTVTISILPMQFITCKSTFTITLLGFSSLPIPQMTKS